MRMTEGLLRETLFFGGAFKELSKEEVNKKVNFLYNFIGECFVEKEVELSTPSPHFLDANRSVKEIITEIQTKNRTEQILILKGSINALLASAEFKDWESIIDRIGETFEEHSQTKDFKKWEEEQEERKELKELCSDYCIYFDTQYTGKDPDKMPLSELKEYLRPKIQESFDKGHEIGLLEKEIIDEAPKKPSRPMKKPKQEFDPSKYCNGDLLT